MVHINLHTLLPTIVAGLKLAVTLVVMSIAADLGLAQINVQVTSGPNTTQYQLSGNKTDVSNQLKQILTNQLVDGCSCFVWADQPYETPFANVSVKANQCKINFHNVLLKAPVGLPFDHVLRLAGIGIKLTGAQVDGNGPAIDAMGNNTGRGEGIRVVGSDCQLVDCRASNMPDGSVANCFYIAGENSSVYRCQGINPGYACFRNVANSAIFDQIEARIDRATRNGRNRLFNVDSTLAVERGTVTIRNSMLHADFTDKHLPDKLREVVMNFDPGDSNEKGLDNLVIENCTIKLGESVRSIRNHHVFKIKNVTHSRLDKLTVMTPLSYQGWVMRLQKTQADITMNCQVLNCHWDQGINFDSELKTMIISNCQLGKPTSYANELLNDINFPIDMLIERSRLIHQKSLASLRSDNKKCRLKIRNVSFISETSNPNTYVFRSKVPTRPSFFNAINFQYAKSDGSPKHHKLWLAYSPATRLALSSYRGLDNTLLFDPDLGVAKQTKDGRTVNATGSSKILGPPFIGISGQTGDKIFLSTEQNRHNYGWENADFWSWNSAFNRWVPSTAR